MYLDVPGVLAAEALASGRYPVGLAWLALCAVTAVLVPCALAEAARS